MPDLDPTRTREKTIRINRSEITDVKLLRIHHHVIHKDTAVADADFLTVELHVAAKTYTAANLHITGSEIRRMEPACDFLEVSGNPVENS
jgi:hypothetical protein